MLTNNPPGTTALLVRVVPAIHRLLRSLVAETKPAGGLAGYRALVQLVDHGPLGLKELAARDGVEPPTMSRTVEALVQAGLVDRHPGDDRRSVRLTPTPAGTAAVTQTRADLARRLEGPVTGWTETQHRHVAEALDLIERSFL